MWDKIGKLAWEAGKKYVEYRGVDGTIEDIGTLTDKAKNMFGGNNSRSNGNEYDSDNYDYDDVDDDTYDDVDDNDSFDSNFDDFTNEYFALIDDDEYDHAIELTKGYYKANGLTRDYLFYYLLGNAQGYMSPDKLNASVSNLSQAKSLAPADTDDYDTICNRLDEVKGRQEYCVNFNSTMKRIDEYVASKDYEMAEATLSKFYSKYENNVHDFFYWMKLFEIHGDSRMENSDDELADLNQLEEYLQEMSDCVNGDPDFAETYDEKVAVYDAIEELQATASDNKKIHPVQASDSQESHPAQASDSLTDDEREYLTELKECLDDGTISERESRLLDRLRKSLGITPARIAELEAKVSK